MTRHFRYPKLKSIDFGNKVKMANMTGGHVELNSILVTISKFGRFNILQFGDIRRDICSTYTSSFSGYTYLQQKKNDSAYYIFFYLCFQCNACLSLHHVLAEAVQFWPHSLHQHFRYPLLGRPLKIN